MAVTVPSPSSGVISARANRNVTASVETKWHTSKVQRALGTGMRKRLAVAAAVVQSAVVKNISQPVTKGSGPRGGQVILNRSRAGQYPKADTTQLLKSVFSGVDKDVKGDEIGFVGIPLHYGLILETRMDRLLLVASMLEKASEIRQILTRPGLGK